MSAVTFKHILVVEDHADSAVMLARLLKRSGYEVTIANKVSDALATVTEIAKSDCPINLVVSDLGLPDGTGYELMEKLRADFALPGIALSGYGQSSDVARAVEAGFSYHLTKPIDFDRLKSAIKKLAELN